MFILTIKPVFARITPEDIVNAKKQSYELKVKTYTPENKNKLESLFNKIEDINRKRTQELSFIMGTQAQILDEYQKRIGKETEAITNARYWVTYAHEAVAYQAAKIYVFELTSETNLKNDALATINKFQSELNYARSQVVKSQKILAAVVKK